MPDAREIECAVLGNDAPEASVPGEIVPSREFYDYEAKYIDSGSRTEIPAQLDRRRSPTRCGARPSLAFEAIDGAGLARVDFLLSRIDGRALRQRDQHDARLHDDQHVLEAVGSASGVDYPTLVDRLIALAIERHAEKQELKTSAF